MTPTGTDTTHKVREDRLRRMAQRQGYTLTKSRRRDPRAIDYGTYGLANTGTGMLVLGDQDTGYGLDLDEVEDFLTAD